MIITITFPFLKRWKDSRKIKLTRTQAQIITAMLENHRKDLSNEPYEQKEVAKMEDVLDAQLFGQVRRNGEWVKSSNWKVS